MRFILRSTETWTSSLHGNISRSFVKVNKTLNFLNTFNPINGYKGCRHRICVDYDFVDWLLFFVNVGTMGSLVLALFASPISRLDVLPSALQQESVLTTITTLLKVLQSMSPPIKTFSCSTIVSHGYLSFHFNPLNPELNPICYLLALLAHDFLHVSRIRIKSLNLRLLMLYIYIWHY
jgi:hypothetical protein